MLIRTADQILADIEAAGGDVDEEGNLPAGLSPLVVRVCKYGCGREAEPDRLSCRLCRSRRARKGDPQPHKPARCTCGQCPATVKNRTFRSGRKVELIGDVWLIAEPPIAVEQVGDVWLSPVV